MELSSWVLATRISCKLKLCSEEVAVLYRQRDRQRKRETEKDILEVQFQEFISNGDLHMNASSLIFIWSPRLFHRSSPNFLPTVISHPNSHNTSNTTFPLPEYLKHSDLLHMNFPLILYFKGYSALQLSAVPISPFLSPPNRIGMRQYNMVWQSDSL